MKTKKSDNICIRLIYTGYCPEDCTDGGCNIKNNKHKKKVKK